MSTILDLAFVLLVLVLVGALVSEIRAWKAPNQTWKDWIRDSFNVVED